jgi:hypothetical protein
MRVDRVGLAGAPHRASRPLHLDHGEAGGGQRAGQSDAVAAGALQRDTRRGPGEQAA